MSRLAFLAILASVGSAAAQDGPSFDCGKAESSAEQVVCADADLAALDRLVADRYTAAVEVVQGLDAGAEEAEHELRAYQRGWVEGRDECWKSDDLRDCVEAEYLRREGQLVAQYLLQEPISVVAWQCGGNPANEVVTYFFDTRLPSVRIERGDTIDTGSLVPTATGSKYEASFGRSIWIKGEEAIYREADADGSEVDCAS